VFHKLSKNIRIQYHHIRDIIHKGTITLQYIKTKEKITNILTKALPRGRFVYLRDRLGTMHNTLFPIGECGLE